MGQDKKLIRQAFRDACFKRDQYRCAYCKWKPKPENIEKELDVHHITNRNDMPNGGYVLENGISLCARCHYNAEQYLQIGSCMDFAASKLYIIINSSYERAVEASKLKM